MKTQAQKVHEFHGFEKALEAQKTVKKILTKNPNACTMDIAKALLAMAKRQGSGDLNRAEDAIIDILYYAAQRLRALVREKTNRSSEKMRREIAAECAKKMRQIIAQDLLNTTFAVARAAKALPAAMLKRGKDDETLGTYFSEKEVVSYVKIQKPRSE